MIILNDKWAIKIDAAGLNYMPHKFEPEREVKVVRTGEVKTKPAGYYSIDRYYSGFPQAIRGIASYEIDVLATEPSNFDEFIDKAQSMMDNLYQDCLKNIPHK